VYFSIFKTLRKVKKNMFGNTFCIFVVEAKGKNIKRK